IAEGTSPPAFDVHAPLLSLPAILHTTQATVQADVPYICADQQLVDHWCQVLSAITGFRVGIAWQGDPKFSGDRLRSIPLQHFAPLAEVSKVRLVSLQKGPGMEQLREAHFPIVDLGEGLDEASGPFMDTAAVMRNLDLVVTSDTAIAHLAGALGM